jgi:hypothetical protein
MSRNTRMMSNTQEVGGPKVEKSLQQVGRGRIPDCDDKRDPGPPRPFRRFLRAVPRGSAGSVLWSVIKSHSSGSEVMSYIRKLS